MILRVLTFHVPSGKDPTTLAEKLLQRVRALPEVRRADFGVSTSDPTQVAGVFTFDSPEALERYRNSDVYKEASAMLQEGWLDTSKGAPQEQTFEIIQP